MNLRDVQYFAVVAEHKHLGRAAEALDMSQPALSMSLRRLETFLHAKLVKRTPKGVELTPAGEAVYAHARRLRLSVDDIAREVSDLHQGYTGRLRVDSSARFGVHLVPAACAALLREAPRLTLRISLGESSKSIPALSRGELDIYLTTNTLDRYDDLVHQHLFDEEWVVGAASSHRLARKKNVTLADLKHERWVLGMYGPAQDDLIRTFEKKGMPAPAIAAEVNSMLLRRELVAATNWLTIGPREFFQESATQTGVVALPVKALSSCRSVCAWYRKDAYLSPVARRFFEILKNTARNIARNN